MDRFSTSYIFDRWMTIDLVGKECENMIMWVVYSVELEKRGVIHRIR